MTIVLVHSSSLKVQVSVKGHRRSSQKPSETNKIRLEGWGFKKLHFGLQMVLNVHFGLRVEKPEVGTFVHFRGKVGVLSDTNFARFAGLVQTFAMDPERILLTFSGQTGTDCHLSWADSQGVKSR